MSENTTSILIDLGCGRDKYQDSNFKVIGIDLWSKSNADIRASCMDLPIRTGVVKKIYARHFFEHFTYDQLRLIFEECYRILQPDGEIEIIVPHFSCISAYQDPTHRMFFTKRTFFKFGPMGFKPIQFEFHWFRKPYTGRFPQFINAINKMINKFHTYERFFGLIGGVYEMSCIMKKDPLMLDTEHTDGAKILG
ncbi:MAG: class I SAM-dependent methyltransferase [Calditrichaeota bacterium]|nr:class I SAM-dependent methyltransferase [Calditrichota bacterium]